MRDRSERLSIIFLAVLTLVYFAVGSVTGRGPGLTPGQIAIDVPGALLTLALLVSLSSGSFDISIIGAYSIILAAFGRATRPSDTYVLALLVVAMMLTIMSGLLSAAIRIRVLVGVLAFFVYRGVGLQISSGGVVSVETGSRIVALVGRRSGPHLVILAVATFACWFVLGHTRAGRSIRANALLNLQLGTKIDRPLLVLSRAVCGGLVWLAALSSYARVGAATALSGDALLVLVIAAVLIGNGAFRATWPAPFRATVIYLVLVGIRNVLVGEGWKVSAIEVLVGVAALVSLVLHENTRIGRRTDHAVA